jgi:hypothetical protein
VVADGGVFLRIDAGDPALVPANLDELTDSSQTSYWQIEALKMELDGVVSEPTEPQPAAPQTAEAHR